MEVYGLYYTDLSLSLSLSRDCVECKHFKRGKLFDDDTCTRICRDEIRLVDDLGTIITLSFYFIIISFYL